MPLNYSLKNIPIPPRDMYMKKLIEMCESVMKRMRWRAFFHLKREDDEGMCDEDEYYGFNSRRCPPQIDELLHFEEDMAKLIGNIEFRRPHDSFQSTLQRDAEYIRGSSDIFVPADKTKNIYRMGGAQYERLLQENVTKHYKVAQENAYNNINKEARTIASGLDIADRMDIMAKRESFITLKDHKDNFENSLPCRLINPAKSEMGKISKQILDGINSKLRSELDITLWKNTAAVIKWFRSIDMKEGCTFISFDIVEFYPSISEDLLERAIRFAKERVEITDEEVGIIMHSRKSLLFSKERTWMKKEGTGLFDVAMGSYDGAEVCELVGIFALSQLPERFNRRDVGLYRDDGLAIFRDLSGSAVERAKKDIIKSFQELGLRITIQANLKIVNFLDVTFNLCNGKYYPYRKPNDKPLYINRLSNHPPSILRQLPASISRRLTDISCDEDVFQEAAPLYNTALKESGFKEDVEYVASRKTMEPVAKRKRARRVTWFNPPYSKSVMTRVGQRFLKLVDKHFPVGSKLHKVFNRSTVKVSYSCMPNMANIIKRHNARIRGEQQGGDNQPRYCNCRIPEQCPLSGRCLTNNIVYKATVDTNGDRAPKVYIGSTETPFKQRYANHLTSFRHEKHESRTELSKYIWKLKREGNIFRVSWDILKRAPAYSCLSKRCDLCLTEKLMISSADKPTLLNKRSELVSKCRHQNKFCLARFVGGVT